MLAKDNRADQVLQPLRRHRQQKGPAIALGCDPLSVVRQRDLLDQTVEAGYGQGPGESGSAVRSCVSGRELIDKGFPDDVELAAAIDLAATVPCWNTRSATREFNARAIPEVPLGCTR